MVRDQPDQPETVPAALNNIRDAFPEWDAGRIHETAVASYQHLFALGLEVSFAPRLINPSGYAAHLEFADIAPAMRHLLGDRPVLLITGHCGNWELIGYSIAMLGFPLAAIYRPLDLKPLDAWLRRTRGARGLTLLSKFGAVRTIPPMLARRVPVGLVADQSGGDRGVFVPYFGRLTSTYKSIGLLAMESGATLVCGMARRLRPEERAARRLEPGRLGYIVELFDHFGEEDWRDQPDPLFYITARYRRAMEMMVRAAPEQYLWMHRIWRARPHHERTGKPFPGGLREKLASLPWMSGADVEAVVERSGKDAELCARGAFGG